MCGLIYHSDSKIIAFGQFYFMLHQINSRFHVPSVRSSFLPGRTLNLSIVQHYNFGRYHPISKFLTTGMLLTQLLVNSNANIIKTPYHMGHIFDFIQSIVKT